jgi:uncharacterized pyridoxamine 5'-phosphate oxidase family protein
MKSKMYITGNKNIKLIKTIGTPTINNISFSLNPQNSFVYLRIRAKTIKLKNISIKKYKNLRSKNESNKLNGTNNI